VSSPDVKHWVNRFRLAEQVSNEAKRSRPLPVPDDCLTRALEMMQLAEESGIRKPAGIPDEDLVVYQRWGRLCAPYVRAARR